jgi:hypothetical protein
MPIDRARRTGGDGVLVVVPMRIWLLAFPGPTRSIVWASQKTGPT